MIVVHVRSRTVRPDGSFNYDFTSVFADAAHAFADSEVQRAVERGCVVTINSGDDERDSLGQAASRAIVSTLSTRDHEAEGDASVEDLLDKVAGLDELVGWVRS